MYQKKRILGKHRIKPKGMTIEYFFIFRKKKTLQTRMSLCKVLRLTQRVSGSPGICRLMSSQAPTFSSTNDTSKVVARLGMPNIATMVLSGKPNRPFPDSYQVDLDSFTPAAISAVSMITEAMSNQEWDSLEDLV